MPVQLSPEALEDLWDIWAFIASDNPDAADRVLTKIRAAFVMLAEQPQIGHIRRDLTSKDLLFWPVGSRLIVYRTVTEGINVAAVLHGARHVERILRDRGDS